MSCWWMNSLYGHSTQLISDEYCNGVDDKPWCGVYLTVTSIGVCDGGECSTLLKPYNM